MKNIIKSIFCMFTSIFIFTSFAFAETTTTTTQDTSCNYASRAHLNKMAGSVTASADFKYEKDGSVSFAITIYNISEDIYIVVQPNNRNALAAKEEPIEIFPDMTTNNLYTLNVKNTTDIIDYELTIRTTKFGCVHDIRKFTVTKPKKNKFHDMNICKYESVIDYYYCQEWTTTEFSINDEEIINKINKERQKQNEKKTTACTDCESGQESIQKKRRLQMYIIAGLILAIIIDVILIIIMIKNVRSASVW